MGDLMSRSPQNVDPRLEWEANLDTNTGQSNGRLFHTFAVRDLDLLQPAAVQNRIELQTQIAGLDWLTIVSGCDSEL
jgi:hypothetical protein